MKELLYSNLNKDQIATKLLSIAKEKLLVKRVVYQYRTHKFYSSIFDQSEVESQLYITVTNVINALERYNKNQALIFKRKELEKSLTASEFNKIKEPSPSLKKKVIKIAAVSEATYKEDLEKILSADNKDLVLDSEAFLTGYLINAFNNNIKREYSKYQTHKRLSKEMVHIDAYHDESKESSVNYLQALGSVDPEEEKAYTSAIVEMVKFLRNYDKKQNHVSGNQKSQLAKLFCCIVNPKKVEDSEELRERFGWSQYLLNKNKETLIRKLQEEFADCQNDIMNFLESREQYRKAN